MKQKDIDCQGNGDVIGNAKLTRTNWKTTSPTNIPPANDFKPLPGNPAYRRGLSQANMRKDYFGKTRPSIPTIGAIEVTQ